MRMKNFMNHGCTKELTQVYSSINDHSGNRSESVTMSGATTRER